jgi:hypothetical protein
MKTRFALEEALQECMELELEAEERDEAEPTAPAKVAVAVVQQYKDDPVVYVFKDEEAARRAIVEEYGEINGLDPDTATLEDLNNLGDLHFSIETHDILG